MPTTDAPLELLDRQPTAGGDRVPLLFVHGLGHGAWWASPPSSRTSC